MSRPRVGFLGVGWIGRHRMDAMLATGAIEAVAVSDPSTNAVADALRLAPAATPVDTLAAMLALDLDGVVIATPSALHADQAIDALHAGAAVFCQKPLGRTAAEVGAVVAAARGADRRLAVDFSYRHTEGMRRIKTKIGAGSLGRVHAVDLVFHNAYGPDKPWFYDRALAGGGCVMDLGVHLVDLALWTLDFPAVSSVTARLSAGGELLEDGRSVEDFALATLTLDTGTVVQLSCSWRLHAGCDAVISAAFYGTQGGAALRNVGGSFYDFSAELYRGTAREVLAAPPDAWGGRAAAAWATDLASPEREGGRFDGKSADQLIAVSDAVDRIYRAA